MARKNDIPIVEKRTRSQSVSSRKEHNVEKKTRLQITKSSVHGEKVSYTYYIHCFEFYLRPILFFFSIPQSQVDKNSVMPHNDEWNGKKTRLQLTSQLPTDRSPDNSEKSTQTKFQDIDIMSKRTRSKSGIRSSTNMEEVSYILN